MRSLKNLSRMPLATGLAVGLLSWGSFVTGQTHLAPPVSAAKDPTCVADLSNVCVLRTERQRLSFAVNSDGVLEANYNSQTEIGEALQDEAQAAAPLLTVPVGDDLMARVQAGEMTADEAQVVAAELTNADGLSYSTPTWAQLKKDLGFNDDAQFEAEDLAQLLLTHMQVTLGIGPVTASYLATRLVLSGPTQSALAQSQGVSLEAKQDDVEPTSAAPAPNQN